MLTQNRYKGRHTQDELHCILLVRFIFTFIFFVFFFYSFIQSFLRLFSLRHLFLFLSYFFAKKSLNAKTTELKTKKKKNNIRCTFIKQSLDHTRCDKLIDILPLSIFFYCCFKKKRMLAKLIYSFISNFFLFIKCYANQFHLKCTVRKASNHPTW